MQEFLNYPAAAGSRHPAPTPAAGAYQVMVEYANHGEAKPPTLVDVRPGLYRTRDEAMQAAHLTAYEYQPPDPWSPNGRMVFADGTEGFLTILQGAVSTFHFSSRVVRRLPDYPVRAVPMAQPGQNHADPPPMQWPHRQ